MNDRTNDNLPDRLSHAGSPVAEIDLLIGRIVDGEANPDQRQHFESLASHDSSLWRRLALRHQDMAMLATHIEPTLNAAEKIELPLIAGEQPVIAAIGDGGHASQATSFANRTAQSPWWLAASGWAAMIAVAAVWGGSLLVSQRNASEHLNSVENARAVSSETPEQHLAQYMHAPYVLGDMPPTLLSLEELSDGRYAVSYLRRIVEVKYYDRAEDIPLDRDGNLSTSPRELRQVPPDKAAPLPKPLD